MNDSADKLLGQLGGVDSSPSAPAPSPSTDSQIPVSTEKRDHWRILLVDLIYLLNASFRDAHYWEGVKAEKDTLKQFIKILHELNQMPGHDGTVSIHFRGSAGTKASEKADYVVSFGDLNVDAAAISAVVKRMGIRVKHLEGRLIKAFEVFSAQGIKTVKLKIPDASDEALERMRIALRIMACYKQAVENESAIEYVKDGNTRSIQPVLNENRLPDLNLTLLAALNGLNTENMRELVQKVDLLMKRPQTRSAVRYANVYQTVFSIKSLRSRLVRPPLEINSDQASATEKDQPAAAVDGGGTGGGGGPAAPGVADPAVLKANVAKFVKQAYGDSPETAARVMKSIFGDDYKQLDMEGLEGRLHLITDLLATMEKSPEGQEIMQGVLERIQDGMDHLPGQILDDLVIDDEGIKIWDGDQEKVIAESNENLLQVIDTSKQRSAARKKMRKVFYPDAQFSDQDYQELAATFGLPPAEAEQIVKLFQSCFDRQENFQRALFEKKVGDFAAYPKRIFELLWEFLRETPRRSNRLPLLNSLQLLVKELQQPKQAIKILLADFIVDPASVSYPDRNALMLTIQFLRTYNKEINMDIEITPEEVLLVKEGLDPAVAKYVAWKIDGDQKPFVEKIITIRKKLLEAFEREDPDAAGMPVRFLLALEREVHILLALVGGKTAEAVIRGALSVYGNPASRIYLLNENPKNTASLLQHLAVLIRSLGRVGQQEDIALLDEIRNRQQSFLDLADDPRHGAQVRRTLGWIDLAASEIRNRQA